MRYLGGKSRLAKKIVEAIHPERFPFIWEPFCGGFAVTAELGLAAPASTILASDVHPGIVALGRALSSGWLPTELGRPLTDGEHQAAKDLPDTDPRKAMIGFGCSFGGMWFHTNATSPGRSYHDETVRNFRSAAPKLRRVCFDLVDFLQAEPIPSVGLLIYCDPPYRGTFGYSTGAFDSEAFDRRCLQWRELGAKVFVSEFNAPWTVVAEFRRGIDVGSNSGSGRERKTGVDRLYEVLT
jgi:hypothetical protein